MSDNVMNGIFNRIQFERTDWSDPPNLDAAAKALAEFLIEQPDKIELAREALRSAIGWKRRNDKLINEFQKWCILLRKRAKFCKVPIDYQHFFEYLQDCFKTCRTLENYENMCGLVPEYYAELYYQKRYESVNPHRLATGCKVLVDGQAIIYEPQVATIDGENNDSDERRVSVDIAAWEGSFLDFMEIKISPEAFKTTNIKYFRLLRSNLLDKKFKHLIRLYTWGKRDMLIERLAILGVCEDEFYLLVGKELLELPSVEVIALSC